MDRYNGMGGYNGIGSGGSKIEDYLNGGSKVMVGGEPYEVYTVKLGNTQGGKGIAYVLVPAGYGKLPEGQKHGQKGTQGKSEMPKIDYSGKGPGKDMPDKYSNASGKLAGMDRSTSETSKRPPINPYKEKKDKRDRK